MRALVAGNWKMNGVRADLARLIAPLRDLPERHATDVVVCPPATLLAAAADLCAGSAVEVGAQDCDARPCGAHTGDVAATQIADAGARWVILGHSERRADHHETDARVRAKVAAAIAAGLTPIVCVGETAAERAAGTQAEVVGRQIDGSLPDGFDGVVAYEPIWAIGTGRVAGPAEIAAMHAFIRGALTRRLGAGGAKVRILYGGSVKAAHAATVFAVPEVAGALVGGASLDPIEFRAIVAAAGVLSKAAAGA